MSKIVSLKEFLLNEVIQFSNAAKYGQIVILTGGPGSGKSFVKDWFLDVANYKTRDVDEYKIKFLKNIQKKSKSNDKLSEDEQKIMNHLNEHNGNIKKFLGNNANGTLIHMYVNKKLETKLSEIHYKLLDKIENLITPIFENHLKYEDGVEFLDNKIFPELKKILFDLIQKFYISIFNERPTNSDMIKDINLTFFPKFIEKIKAIKDFKLLKNKIVENLQGLLRLILENEESYPKDLLIRHSAAKVTSTENLPNILFDISFKDTWYMETIIPKFIETGYSPNNIHMVWILTDLELAELRNSKRERVMSTETLHAMHAGVLKSMLSFITNEDNLIPKFLNGDIYIVNNEEIDIPNIDKDRDQKNDKTLQYLDKDNSRKFIFKSKDMKKIKIKNAGNARIDLSKLNTFNISDSIHKTIKRLDDNVHNISNSEQHQNSINYSKQVIKKINPK